MSRSMLLLLVAAGLLAAAAYLSWLYVQWGWMAGNPGLDPEHIARFTAWSNWCGLGAAFSAISAVVAAVSATQLRQEAKHP